MSAAPSTRPPSEEEQFFLRQSYENVVSSLAHIEEMAKHLISAVGVVAGLVLAAAQIGERGLEGLLWPFVLWVLSLLLATLVVFPMRYGHQAGVPKDIRDTFVRIRKRKWGLLLSATLTFAGGLLWAVLTLIR